VTHGITNIAAWSGFTALILFIIVLGGSTGGAAQLTGIISIVTLTIHAMIALGWVEAAVFAAICLTVTFIMENIGVLTGFPFGRYTFIVGRDMTHIGEIPMIVGPLYFGMGYVFSPGMRWSGLSLNRFGSSVQHLQMNS